MPKRKGRQPKKQPDELRAVEELPAALDNWAYRINALEDEGVMEQYADDLGFHWRSLTHRERKALRRQREQDLAWAASKRRGSQREKMRRLYVERRPLEASDWSTCRWVARQVEVSDTAAYKATRGLPGNANRRKGSQRAV